LFFFFPRRPKQNELAKKTESSRSLSRPIRHPPFGHAPEAKSSTSLVDCAMQGVFSLFNNNLQRAGAIVEQFEQGRLSSIFQVWFGISL